MIKFSTFYENNPHFTHVWQKVHFTLPGLLLTFDLFIVMFKELP